MDTEWTENDVKSTITNPVYTGIEPFPPITAFKLWLDTALRMIEEDGAKIVINDVIDYFEKENPNLAPNPKPYITQAQCDSRAALICLWTDLQALSQEKSK